jgi:hypothetical protein
MVPKVLVSTVVAVVNQLRRRERVRRSYAPDELRVLFIGESPPAGSTFFYDANSILYGATREAFIGAFPKLAKEPDFLSAFQSMGCFLEDLSREPINKLPKAEKLKARSAAVPGLARRLNGLTPEVIVVVVIGIKPEVTRAIEKGGLDDIPRLALPFPSAYHRKRYRDELTPLVAKWRRRGILAPPSGKSPSTTSEQRGHDAAA